MEKLKERVADLLHVLWRGIGGEYKSRYRASIWTQFEDAVRSCAYTNNLAKFVNKFCLAFDGTIGRNAEDRTRAEEILNSGQDRQLLKLLREETALLVLMVRVRQQEIRESYKEMEDIERNGELDL